uniref:Uncharacterized protein n=1 Tax=Anguilla anguilla TaxID=7936 RepID=A0A0E9RC29_ANGAN
MISKYFFRFSSCVVMPSVSCSLLIFNHGSMTGRYNMTSYHFVCHTCHYICVF